MVQPEEPFLVDSDVLIEYPRGRPAAIEFLESLLERSKEPLLLSVITVAELYSGLKGEREESDVEVALEAFEIVPLTPEMAREGGLLRLAYRPSHGLALADALIASTTKTVHATLITFHRRPFPMLDRVEIPYSRT